MFALAATIAAVSSASVLLLTQLAGSRSGQDEPAHPGFLAAALGAPQSAAPLVREPARDTRVAIREGGYEIEHGRDGLTLALDEAAGDDWSRFARGASRRTGFGIETVTVDDERVEQFLTVQRRQGARTWRWRLGTGTLEPSSTADGAVVFANSPLRIRPVAILDARGRDVTPTGIRWQLGRSGGTWSLELRLDDARLPLPYVIDPAVDYPSPLYLSSQASAVSNSWDLLTTSPTGANSATSTRPNRNTAGYFQWRPGVSANNTEETPGTPTGRGWVVDTAGATGFPAGTWSFQIRTQALANTVNGAAIAAVGMWKGTISGGVFTPTAQVMAVTDDPASQNLRSTNAATNRTISIPGVAKFALASNERLYVELWRNQLANINSNTANERTVTLIVNDGNSRITHPAADDTGPSHAVSVTEGTSPEAQYFDAAGKTVYYNPTTVAGDFTVTDAIADAGSGPYSVTFPDVSLTGFTHAAETDTASPFTSTSYAWTTANVASPGAQTLTAEDLALQTSTDTLTITRDATPPSGMSASATGGFYTSPSVAVTLANGTDGGAGVDTTSGVVERDEAPLDNGDGTCDVFPDTWATVTLTGGNDTTVASGTCYRYRYTISDRVGNAGTQAGTSATAKVDSSAPGAPALSFGGFSNAYESGGTVYYRPTGSASFDVTASATDGQSGVAGYAFPAAASGWTVSGSGAARTYTHAGSPSDPGDPNDVTATNGAGLVSPATGYTVTPDGSAPTGGAVGVNGTAAAGAGTASYDIDGSFAIDSRTDYADGGGSGLASSTLVRESATLAGDSCGAFASATTLVGTPAQSGLADGCYRYTLTGTDNVGNSASISTVVKVDSAAPASAADALAAYQTAAGFTVTYAASDASSGPKEVELWVDGPGAGSYALADTDTTPASPSFSFTASEGDGLYRFYTRARDNALNLEAAPGAADASTTLDTADPVSSADTLAAESGSTALTIGYSASDATAGVQEVELWARGPSDGSYSLAATDNTPASPSFSYTASQGDGTYRFYTRARDAAGRTEAAPGAEDSLTLVDTTKPTSSADGLAAFATSSPITVAYTASDAGVGVQEVELWVDGPGAGGYALSATDTTPASPSFSFAAGEGDGLYRFYTRARDDVGNSEDAPGAADTSTSLDTAKPSSSADALATYQTATGLTVGYSSSDAVSGVDEVELWVDGPGAGSYALAGTDATPASPSFSFTASEGDGLYRFYTRARDNAGNAEDAAGSADASTTVDTAKPSSSADALAVYQPDPTFTVAYARADAVSGVDAVELWVDGPGAGSYALAATDADPSTPAFAYTAAEGDGLYRFYTLARDAAGNAEDAPATPPDASTTLETSPPSAPALAFGSFTNASSTGTTVYVREGVAGGFTVTSDSDDPESGVDHHTFPSFWSAGGNVAGDPAGHAYAFGASDTAPAGAQTVGATNGAGIANAGSSTFTVVADTTAPASSSQCDGGSCAPWQTSSPVTVTLSASDAGSGLDEIRYTTDGSEPSPVNGTVYAGGFALAATATVKFRAYDAVGNEEPVSTQLVRIDATPPSATMGDPGPDLAGTVNLTSVTSDGGSGVATVVYERSPANAATWTATPSAWNTTLVPDGLYDLRVTATDAAGNATTSAVVEDRRVDNVFPDTTLDAQPSDPSNDATPTFQFTSTEAGSTFECRVDGGAWAACASPHTTAALADGDRSFEVRAIDAASNPDPTPAAATWLVDTAAPAGGSVTVAAGYDIDGSVAIAADNGADPGSGIDAASAVVERESATLAAGSCGAFSGSWTSVSAPDASVANATCYRYRLRVSDNAGNWATFTSASEVKVDLSDPSTPTLALGALTNAVLNGGAVHFRPGTSGSFDVTPSASDAESGIAGYGHPSLGSGWSRAGNTWSFGAAAADPAEPNDVTATSGSGRTSAPASFTVSADSTGPTTTALCDGAACSAGWYTSSPVSVTLSAADAGAGVAEIRYTTDGSEPTVTSPLYGGAITATPGTTTIKFRAEDALGNLEPVATLVVRIDVTAPTTPALSLSGFANASESGGIVYFRPGAPGGFTVTASASDPESGIASTSFPALGSGWSESGGAYTFSSSAVDPTEPQEVTSTNGAGLLSAGAGLTITADAAAPATTVACTGGCAPWHTTAPVTVTLAATDALSGLEEIRYSTDGSAPATVYAGPFAISAEGTAAVTFAARDAVGNVEATQTQLVRLDTVAPAASIADPGVYARGDVSLDSTQSDATSGVATVQFRYRPIAGAWANTPATWDTDALANGDYELDVVVTDVAGNPTTSSPVAVTVDNLAPSITLDAPASPASGTVTLTSTATDAHSGVDAVEYEFLHPVDGWTATSSSWDTTDAPDGSYDLRARATDNAGNVSGWSVVAGIQVDNNAPAVALTAPAAGSYLNAASSDPFVLTATADDAGGTGVQKVDFFQWSGGAWSLVDTDTTSDYDAAWTLPADGAHRVMARASDLAGHTSESEVTVTVDRTAPTAGITDPGPYLRLSPPLVGSATDATSGVNSVAFQRSPAGAGTWTTIAADATAPYSATFDTTTGATPDGLYDLRVFVTDVAGNSSTAVVSSRRVDNTAPTGSLTDPGDYLRGAISLSGSAADGGSGVASVTFRRSPEGTAEWTTISTDSDGGDGWSAALDTSSGATPDGLYDFQLVVTDRAGNGHEHAVGSRRIDNTKPTAAIADPGANLRGSITLSGDSTDLGGSGVAAVLFERSPAGAGSWTAISTDADESNGWSAGFVTTTVADGLYDFRITATDRAGNVETSVVAGRRIDNTAPSAGITDPGQYLRSTVVLTGSADDAGSGVASVEFQRSPAGSGGPWTQVGAVDTDAGDGWSASWASGPDGVYDFRVLVTDVAGNSATASVASRMVDNTAPETNNDAPASSASAVTVTLTVGDAGSGPSATQFRVDGGAWQSGTTVTIAAPADHSNDGVHTIEYYSTDAAGNVEGIESVDVLVDTTGPSGSVDDPANYLRGLVALSASPSDPDDVSKVRFEFAPAGSGAWAQIGADVLAAPYEVTWDTTGVAEGAYDLQVTMFDTLDNETVTSLPGKTVDNAAPSLAITAPAAGAIKSNNVGITANADDATAGIKEVEFRVKPSGAAGFSSVGVDATGSPYAVSWASAGAADGPAEIEVVARDWAGNETTATRTITLDNNAPTVTLTAPGAAVSGDVALTASGSGDITEIDFLVDGALIGTDSDGSNGWSVTWSTAGDGSRSLTARATDVGGNEGTSPAVTVQVDNTDPDATMTSPTAAATVGGPSVPLAADASDAGSGVANVTYEFRASGGGAWSAIAGTSWDTTPLATGPYDLRAIVTDNAGNSAPSAAITVQVDSTAPTVVLTNPGAGLSGSVTLAATVSGADAQRVVFERSPAGAGSWTEIATDTAAPWSASFDTRSVADGLYDLRASVLDSFGNSNVSVRANVRIDNTAPRIASSTPADGATVSSAGSLDVVATEPLAAVNEAKLDGASIAIAPAGAGFSVAGPFADGPHTVSGELEDVAGKTARFSLHFTVLNGSPAVMPYVEMNGSRESSSSLTSPDGSARVIMPAGAWSDTGTGDWLVVRIQPVLGTGGAASVVDVTARWALAGGEVHSFPVPIEIVLLNTSAHGVVPATLEGSTWRVLRPVPGGSLPGDRQDGFWRDADGVHVVTRHLSMFGLIADAVPPSPPRAVGVVDAEGLKLRWIPGEDDSGQVGQVNLYVNAAPYANYDLGQTEAKLGAWTAADTRSFTFTQLDLAGNESVHSKRLLGVPSLAGLGLAAAERALRDRGFSVGDVTQREASAAPGTVLEPTALALAEEGAAIDLVVAAGAGVPAPQARLLFSVVGTKKLDPRQRTFVAARIKVSRASRVTATLISPRGQRLYTWRLKVRAGATISRLALPRQIRRPGVYRVVFTASSGSQTLRRTIRVQLVGKPGAALRPAKQGTVEVVLAGDSAIRKELALGLRGTRTRLVQTKTDGAYAATGSARRNVRVVVVDVDAYGVRLVRDLHTVFPSVKLVALARRPEDLARAMKAGAAVALPRSSSADAIARVIRRLSAAR